MHNRLRILILEDVPSDAELIERELSKEGYTFTSKIVETRSDFSKQMESFAPDIVLSDYMMPQFTGGEALELARQRYPAIPFIVVTGSMNEEVAVDCMKKGAADYVIKEHLNRLGPAIRVALENKRTREEKDAAVQAVHRKAREWQVTFDAINDGICILSLDHRITRCNEAMRTIAGKPYSEIIGRHCWELVHGTTAPIEGCPIVKMKKSGRKEHLELDLESRWLDVQAFPIIDERSKPYAAVHIISDITERKLAEKRFRDVQKQLIETEKRGAVGTLTAGIAHELNNPMMGILNFVQYCLKNTPRKDKTYPVLRDAEQSTRDCIKIVNNLLTFSRIENQETEEFEKEHLSVILDRVMRILAYRIETENVVVTRNIPERVPVLTTKITNIQQVFLNIIGNALDAVKESDIKEIKIDVESAAGIVKVKIADTGTGISPEDLKKVFDPFFTTKPVGQGTGLGLSVSRGIAEALGGQITCESAVGSGSIFAIQLPTERPESVLIA